MQAKPIRIFLIASVLALFAVGITLKAKPAVPAAPVQSAPATAPKKAEEQFKNIQVLKGMPADQLFPTMQFMAASLGVECDFCHVQNAFDKDDKKPKQIARKMIEMMITINQENFEGHRQVTCNSCHRGSPNPVAIPAVATEEAGMGRPHPPGEMEKPGKENSGPSAEQLLDKFIQASGGAAAIDKVTSRIMKGSIDFGGKSFPIDVYTKDPGERVSFTHMPDGDGVTGFNGHEGWLGTVGHPMREMHGSDMDGAAIDADLHLPTHLKQMFTRTMVQPEKVGDQQTYELIGERDGKPPIHLYFDQQSGLLVRLVRYGDTALGWLPTQIDYADYREVDGVKVPYRWTLARPSGRFTIQLTDMKQNVPIDDAKFVKPASPPPPSK